MVNYESAEIMQKIHLHKNEISFLKVLYVFQFDKQNKIYVTAGWDSKITIFKDSKTLEVMREINNCLNN